MKLIILVGPVASGKTTKAKELEKKGYVRINQDDQGKNGHLELFDQMLNGGNPIVIDRMNFNKEQRARYISQAKDYDYSIKCIVLHESEETCKERARNRFDAHPTVNNEKDLSKALNMFFSRYERPSKDEGFDELEFVYPEGKKMDAVVCDLDGTLCDIEHRRHLIENKNWKDFFKAIPDDKLVLPIMWTIWAAKNSNMEVVYCSGRPDDHKKVTEDWLKKHQVPEGPLFMRRRGDYRKDSIIKEIILDFELLTRYNIFFALDDRQQVVDMFRNRGIKVFQVEKGDF